MRSTPGATRSSQAATRRRYLAQDLRLQALMDALTALTTQQCSSSPLGPPPALRRCDPRLTLGGPRAGREPAVEAAVTRQGAPVRVQAPQRGRSLRRSGEPSPASPISARRLHLPPIPQAESEQVRSRVAGHMSQPRRCQRFQFSRVTNGGGGFASTASIAARLAASLCRSSIRAAIWRADLMFYRVPRKSP
jgi:hypothetical protein